MASKQPKTKLQEFSEKINKAKTKEELQDVLKKLKTYVSLYPSEQGYVLLANVYYMLGDIKEALNIVKPLTSPQAKYLEIVLKNASGDYKNAYNLIQQLLNQGVPKEMENKLNIQKLITLTAVGNLKEAKQIYNQQIKEQILETMPVLASEILPQIEGYIKAEKALKENPKLQKAYETLQRIVKEKYPKVTFTPIIETDPEYPIEELWIKIFIPQRVKKEEIEQIEEKIINGIIFKQNIDINYLFIQSREGEEVVLS